MTSLTAALTDAVRTARAYERAGTPAVRRRVLHDFARRGSRTA